MPTDQMVTFSEDDAPVFVDQPTGAGFCADHFRRVVPEFSIETIPEAVDRPHPTVLAG